jgi:cytoskeletal protein CcmA (bactofilin family)
MFNKKVTVNTNSFDSLVGIDTEITGDIVSTGTVRVDGKVNGSIKAKGNVFVGNNAVVKGDIYASDVTLSGTIEGNIEATGLLRLLSSAKLNGNILVQSFVTDEGAIFHGKCNMLEAAPAQEKQNNKNQE